MDGPLKNHYEEELSKNFIMINDDCLSEKDCKKIIRFFERSDKQKDGTVYDNEVRVDKDQKDTTDIGLKFSDNDWVSNIILNVLKKSITEYCDKYPDIYSILPFGALNEYNLQRYLPGGIFKRHYENFGQNGGGNRCLVWMIYLNDIDNGGKTRFHNQDIRVSPKRGRVVLWPPYWTHPHAGEKLISGKKYIVTGWCGWEE